MKKLTMVLALLATTAMPVMATTPVLVPESEIPQSIDVTDPESCNASMEELLTPATLQAASCPDGARIWYYSDPAKTNQVGTCWHNCCQLWTCTGELTDYYNLFMWSCY